MGSVLIADDDAMVRSVLSRAVEREGHLVTLAVDGQGVLNRLHEAQFDLCIMDARMPGPNLEDRLAAARERGPEMAILLLSGDDVAPSVATGDFRFARKPLGLDTLRSALALIDAGGDAR
jgi:two-component system nitrogen regulation response regulator GlnG